MLDPVGGTMRGVVIRAGILFAIAALVVAAALGLQQLPSSPRDLRGPDTARQALDDYLAGDFAALDAHYSSTADVKSEIERLRQARSSLPDAAPEMVHVGPNTTQYELYHGQYHEDLRVRLNAYFPGRRAVYFQIVVTRPTRPQTNPFVPAEPLGDGAYKIRSINAY
jgi:hypothetical protein